MIDLSEYYNCVNTKACQSINMLLLSARNSFVLLCSIILSHHAIITSAFAASFGNKPGLAFTATASMASKSSTSTELHSSQEEKEKEPLRTVLVTGGCGYIGSHTCLELLKTGQYRVVVIDNLDNSSTKSLDRLKKLIPDMTDEQADDLLQFRNVDIRDPEGLRAVLNEFDDISSCIHFAGLKAVGESVAKPLMYYQTNIAGTCTLLECLKEKKIQHFVFSSSATVSMVMSFVLFCFVLANLKCHGSYFDCVCIIFLEFSPTNVPIICIHLVMNHDSIPSFMLFIQ